jgi:hypothetical protein
MGLFGALCSFFVPGLGQLLQGRIGAVIKIYVLFGVCSAIALTGIGLFVAAPLALLVDLWQIGGALHH